MYLLIVGAGYVGLVSGACFAEMGHHVICLDIDKEKIDSLKKGEIPFFEPGLEELVKKNIQAKRLEFTTDYKSAVEKSTLCFLAVPTPAYPTDSKSKGGCDLTYVFQAAREIGKHMTSYKVIINKSTVPVGTAQKVKEAILSSLPSPVDFDVVSNPEFLKEGTAIADCMKPDRVILGVDSSQALEWMRKLYSTFTLNHERFLVMDIASAEMTKYAANAMLATRISFMNELAGLCELVGANIHNVRQGIGSDSRIGYHFLYAGIGYGGSCFPKDLKALQAMAASFDYPTPLIDAVETINARQKKLLGRKIDAYFSQEGLAGKTIAIWGLSFKPDTDDIREAPSLQLISELLEKGASLRLYDPIALEKTKKIFPHSPPQLQWCQTEYEAASGADAIALVTEWKQFRFVNFEEILKTMKGKAFFDGRNQYKKQEMLTKGFAYYGIGV